MMPQAFPASGAALSAAPRSEARQRITDATRPPEPECVPPLVAAAQVDDATAARIHALARRLAVGLRTRRTRASGVDALMKEFALSSEEGVALMCLAEALLRVPDDATADRLIRDKVAHRDWCAHLGHSPSLFVNAAAWGLLVTGRLVATRSEEGLANALSRLLARRGEPVVRRGMDLAMRLLGERFVTGRTIGEALARARGPQSRGYRYSFDMLGEAAMTADDAQRYVAAYEQAIDAIGNASRGRGVIDGNGVSVKLSALHPRYVWSQRGRVMAELLPKLKALCALARRHDIGLNIDAEEAERLELSLDLLEALVRDDELAGWEGLGFVVQAYQKRAPAVIDRLAELARGSGRRLMVRLVKGAYWDAEIKRAQVDGLAGYPVYTRKVYTDVAYLACARQLLAARDVLYPQFATHNAHSLAAIFHLAGGAYRPGDYEFQCLHGMGEPLYDQLLADPQLRRPVRIYAPVGSHETLLAYLVRRLLENGANSSFVNRIVDERVAVDELIADPIAAAAVLGGAPHPRIPLPVDLFAPLRRNSSGYDLASEPVRARLAAAIDASRTAGFTAAPLVAPAAAGAAQPHAGGASDAAPVANPADHADTVGTVVEAAAGDVAAALAAADAFAAEWAATPPAARAACLDRVADLVERDGPTLVALAVREAGKSWPNAIGEVREAADFCRYYAAQARDWDAASYVPVGPVACISPWNFPLAIFTGQIAAALAAGNPVVAKPAEQTPLIAARVVRLFHAAGVPAGALQLVPGRGETVGAALVADPRVCAVMFTGSTEVALGIHRTLAAHGGDVPLIAETGGQNAMIVDSTALPEQVVADVLVSAFDSAGQRCSALRVLCLQEEIAERVLAMLRGALRELALGDPSDVATDVGPVIDAEAQAALERHVEALRRAGHAPLRHDLPPACARGTFVAPTIVELARLAELEREVFGPVLHVVRYRAQDLDRLVDDINATGYGLTLGIHSRIDETIAAIVRRAEVGNIYVNRTIIGAVVGVQPFGGEGRSGTGPKAGGPLYLHRLLRASPAPALGDVAAPADPAFVALHDWLAGGARGRLARAEVDELLACAAAYARGRLVGGALRLPGPTGEENTLRFLSRGPLACVAPSAAGRLHQLLAAFAAGSRAVVVDDAVSRSLLDVLPGAAQARIDLDRGEFSSALGALLFDGADAEADAWRRRLAARDGPIVALLRPRPRPRYDLARLVAERCVSINTAAAGGNASLLALGD